MILLRKPAEDPFRGNGVQKRVMRAWQLVGRAMTGGHPGDDDEPDESDDPADR